ncbi:MAG: CvpA family protein [Caulobacteraceae bacterium]
MTLFDAIAAIVLLVSGLIGFSRGAVREMITVAAFILAAFAAAYLLPYTGPAARAVVHPTWAATAVALVATFLIVFILLKILAGMAVARLHTQPVLGAADRAIGVGFGILRGLAFLGMFYLVFNAATPREWTPEWISKAKLYPLARASAGVIQSVAPKGMKAAGRYGPMFQNVVKDGFSNEEEPDDVAPEARNRDETSTSPSKKLRNDKSYGKSQRESIDALVERSR